MDKKALTELDVFDKFIPAKELCRELRKAQAIEDSDTIRMVYAKDKKEAKMLLGEKHKPSSPLEEWEA
jgi:hypothetical protein